MEPGSFDGFLASMVERSSWRIRCKLDMLLTLLNTAQVNQEDVVGSNYPLIKEYLLEFADGPLPTSQEHQVFSLQLKSVDLSDSVYKF